jgi:hypothetical protein
MSLVIPVSWEQLRHVANAIMHGIHDVFPPDKDDSNDPISENIRDPTMDGVKLESANFKF